MPTGSEVQPKKFGTFIGVFLPSILTVLGLIMYLRFGWVVGNLGLGLTLVVVLLANAITFITGLSASAIATNIKVGVGGVYYLVSRSLGLETGGAIGVAFYISRTLSITFYCFGLAESILIFWPEASWGPMPDYAVPLFTAAIILIITFLAGRSAELVLKFQIPMLILVSLSVLALIIGVFSHGLQVPEWTPSFRTEPGGFWVIFAVFFPGVTGFLAGIALSGDLKTPGKSIPQGTISSVLTGTLVYIIIPVLLSITILVTPEQLADPDFGIQSWTQVAFLGGALVYPAAWGAILSSAIGSVLSGPRVLQSLSLDGLAPKFLSRLSKTGQPTIATWITGSIALIAVALGELNTVAKFVTVLFLTLYVVINLVAAIEKLVSEPSYRPKINIPWYVSMLGAVGALFVMYLISPLALLFAVGLELAVYIYFRKKTLEQQWGDVNAGFWMRMARFALLQLNRKVISARNWRPLILVFVKDINERIELVKLAAALGQNKGVLTISELIFTHDHLALKRRKEKQQKMLQDLKKHELEAFCEVNVVHSLHGGILNVSKGHGMAGIKTNTIMFGWSGDTQGNIQQLKTIRDLAVAGKNILLVKFNDHESWKSKDHQNIDIWWGGRENNGDLMLILAYMMKLNREWEQARIHIRSVVETEEEKEILLKGLEASLAEARIPGEVNVVLKNGESFRSILHRESDEADIVFLGLNRTEEGEEAKHVAKLEHMASVAKIAVFVQNNSVEDALPILLQVE
jgi:amino acid transporter